MINLFNARYVSKKRKRKSETIFRDEMRCLYASAVRDLGSLSNVMSRKLMKLQFLQFFQKAYQEIKVFKSYTLNILSSKITPIGPRKYCQNEHVGISFENFK